MHTPLCVGKIFHADVLRLPVCLPLPYANNHTKHSGSLNCLPIIVYHYYIVLWVIHNGSDKKIKLSLHFILRKIFHNPFRFFFIFPFYCKKLYIIFFLRIDYFLRVDFFATHTVFFHIYDLL